MLQIWCPPLDEEDIVIDVSVSEELGKSDYKMAYLIHKVSDVDNGSSQIRQSNFRKANFQTFCSAPGQFEGLRSNDVKEHQNLLKDNYKQTQSTSIPVISVNVGKNLKLK